MMGFHVGTYIGIQIYISEWMNETNENITNVPLPLSFVEDHCLPHDNDSIKKFVDVVMKWCDAATASHIVRAVEYSQQNQQKLSA